MCLVISETFHLFCYRQHYFVMPLHHPFLISHPSTADNKSDTDFLNILFGLTKVVPWTITLRLPFSLRKWYIWLIPFAFSLQKYRVIQNYCRGHTQYTPDVTPCDFFLWGYVKDQVYVPPLPASIPEWRYESEPPLKPSPLTCGTNSIIVLMFVETQRLHI